MSYHRKQLATRIGGPISKRPFAGDTSHGPGWYQAIGGISSRPPGRRLSRGTPSLGSLGADDPDPTTLSTPTITDPTFQWQDKVLVQLEAGVNTLRTAELQKWLQILATVSIPLAAAIWNLILKKPKDPTI